MRNRRASASATLLLFLATVGCGCQSWRPVSLTSLEAQTRNIKANSKVRLTGADASTREMIVTKFEFPMITGYVIDSRGGKQLATINLNDVYRVEAREIEKGITASILVGASFVLLQRFGRGSK